MVTRIRPGWSDLVTEATIEGPVDTNITGVSLISFLVGDTETSVPASTKTTILTQVYSATFNNIALVSVSGDNYAKFFLTINTVDIDVRRSGPDRNLQFDFKSNPLGLSSGDVVDIKAEHFNTGQLVDFEATIYGYANPT
jgi:hypothetical protein